MKEKNLLKLALVCSLIGIIVLWGISENVEIDETSIDKIDFSDIDKDVRISGKVKRVNDLDKVLFLEVAQEKIEDIDVILFKDGPVMIDEGDYVMITGSVEEYEGKLEVIGNRVEKT
ncbi:hypothetical protein GF336_01185 [Candidatus Woesearchaeota archaeon]|nr:hypothetical protein [Candidatus Woesearchaeota archaeon]